MATTSVPPTGAAGFADDIRAGWSRRDLWGHLAWRDLRDVYSRSWLGFLWVPVSSAIFILVVGVLFGEILQIRKVPFIAFLALGYVTWQLITGVVNESCNVFIKRRAYVLSSTLPYSVYVFENVWRTFLRFLLALPVALACVAVADTPFAPFFALSAFGAMLILVNGVALGYILGIACLRFGDLREAVRTIMRFLFFLTPIIWQPDMLGTRSYIAEFNPFTHFVAMVRAPLLGAPPSALNWAVTLGVTLALVLCAAWIHARYRAWVAIWL